MKSLKALYRIGAGPSSSHTMGPEKIVTEFLSRHGGADGYIVTLYGSLAATGNGHGTDEVIRKAMPGRVKIVCDTESKDLPHPNTMDVTAVYGDEKVTERAYSVGGGAILFEGRECGDGEDVYSFNSFHEMAAHCRDNDMRLYEYVRECEGDEIFGYLGKVWERMKLTIKEGLAATGTLPGGLDISRKAKFLYR